MVVQWGTFRALEGVEVEEDVDAPWWVEEGGGGKRAAALDGQ